MAPRKPRKPPQPPNRDRARPRGQSRDVTETAIGEGNAPSVTGRRFTPPPRIITAKDDSMEEAIEAFEMGDDSLLFSYDPTATSNPTRPRTQKAGYNSKTHELRIMFREGAARGGETAIYVYYEVPPNVWRNFKRVRSPGKFINRVLNSYAYDREY